MNFIKKALATTLEKGFSSYSGIILNSHVEAFNLEDYEVELEGDEEDYEVSQEKEQFLSDFADYGVSYELGSVTAQLFWDKWGKISSHILVPFMEFTENEEEIEELFELIVIKILSLSQELGVAPGTLTATFGLIVIPWGEMENLALLP